MQDMIKMNIDKNDAKKDSGNDNEVNDADKVNVGGNEQSNPQTDIKDKDLNELNVIVNKSA